MSRSDGVSVFLVLVVVGVVQSQSQVRHAVSASNRFKPSFLFPRAIKNFGGERNNVYHSPPPAAELQNRDQNQSHESVGNPAEWTMSKANLVAEFYTTETAPQPTLMPTPSQMNRDRSHKSFFSFFTNNNNNISRNGNSRNTPYPPRGGNGNFNLVASETNYNPLATALYDHTRNGGGGFSTPFRPIVKFPQQNYIIPSNLRESGYPNNLRPPRGPPTQGPWDANAHINGLRPPVRESPPVPQAQQQAQNGPNPPGSLYLPPHQQGVPPQTQYLPPQQQMQPPKQTSGYISSPKQNHPPAGNSPPSLTEQKETYQPPLSSQEPQLFPPPPPKFVPSQEYLPISPETPASSPPPKVLENYRNQAVYPASTPPEKPIVLVMANTTSGTSSTSPRKPTQFHYPSNSFTQYENEQPPSNIPQQGQTIQSSSVGLQKPASGSPISSSSSSKDLALTEPLSHVLAEANAKTGDAVDKTIRFVIHKPEDEDVVKNAILEDAQTRYEDVRFVQGPTLKVQRKETVYLPPKKKTVVYILLKEPQIDTDVEVMAPEEEEAAPEVYITYQKSDGAVKTKHYSPKPIKEEDMKKYLDIEADSSYGSGEESIVSPRFSKTTSVSLSTSSRTSRTSASMSTEAQKPLSGGSNDTDKNEEGDKENSLLLLKNHRLSSSSYPSVNNGTLPKMKASPLLYSQIPNLLGENGNKNSTKRARSSKETLTPVYPRRVSRNPVQCPTPS